MKKHIFLLGWDCGIPPNLVVDSLLVTDWPYEGWDGETFLVARKLDPTFLDSFAAQVNGLRWRARLSGKIFAGPLLVNSDEELSRDELEMYLKSLSPSKLKAFIKESRF